MTSELFTVFGSSKVASTSGTCSGAVVISGYLNLASDIWTGRSGMFTWVSGSDGLLNQAPQDLRIPKGTALKIWESKVMMNAGAGTAGQVNVDLSNDSGATYRTVVMDGLAGMSGTTELSMRRSGRPLVFPSPDGKTKVRFPFSTDAATGGIFAEYNCEIVELNYE